MIYHCPGLKSFQNETDWTVTCSPDTSEFDWTPPLLNWPGQELATEYQLFDLSNIYVTYCSGLIIHGSTDTTYLKDKDYMYLKHFFSLYIYLYRVPLL